MYIDVGFLCHWCTTDVPWHGVWLQAIVDALSRTELLAEMEWVRGSRPLTLLENLRNTATVCDTKNDKRQQNQETLQKSHVVHHSRGPYHSCEIFGSEPQPRIIVVVTQDWGGRSLSRKRSAMFCDVLCFDMLRWSVMLPVVEGLRISCRYVMILSWHGSSSKATSIHSIYIIYI